MKKIVSGMFVLAVTASLIGLAGAGELDFDGIQAPRISGEKVSNVVITAKVKTIKAKKSKNLPGFKGQTSSCPIGTHPTGIVDDGGEQCVSDYPYWVSCVCETENVTDDSGTYPTCRRILSCQDARGGSGGFAGKGPDQGEQAP